jgi:hypothetical protein
MYRAAGNLENAQEYNLKVVRIKDGGLKYSHILLYFVYDKHDNKCMEFEIKNIQTTPYMYIKSLLLPEKKEGNCTSSAINLLQWVKSKVPDVVSYIELEDASSVTLESDTQTRNITLNLVRKFFKNQTFYEKHNFRIEDAEEEKNYNTSFATVRNYRMDDVCEFLFVLLEPHFAEDGSIHIVELEDCQYQKMYDQLNSIIPHEKEGFEQHYFRIIKSAYTEIANNLLIYGFPASRACKYQLSSKNWLKIRKDSSTTLYSKWLPYYKHFSKTSRKTSDDVIHFMTMVESTLQMFVDLYLLIVPEFMIMRYP